MKTPDFELVSVDGKRRSAFRFRTSSTRRRTSPAYGVVCTPEFFGFNAAFELQYHGRLDASRRDPVPNARRELFEAMVQIAETGAGPKEQLPSMGCSIKWKR